VRRFDPALEDLAAGEGYPRDQVARLAAAVRNHELDGSLGAYPASLAKRWLPLSDRLTEAVLQRCGVGLGVRIVAGDPDAEDPLPPNPTAAAAAVPPPQQAVVPHFEGLARVAKFSALWPDRGAVGRARRRVTGMTPEEVRRWSGGSLTASPSLGLPHCVSHRLPHWVSHTVSPTATPTLWLPHCSNCVFLQTVHNCVSLTGSPSPCLAPSLPLCLSHRLSHTFVESLFQVTAFNLDASARLETVLAQSCNGDWTLLLGEFQLAFVLFCGVHSMAAFNQVTSLTPRQPDASLTPFHPPPPPHLVQFLVSEAR
jgi:hypothetical protein